MAPAADSIGMRRTVTLPAVVVTLVAASAVTWSIPASGHSGGQLPHATLSATGNVVSVRWTAAADDAADVGVALGMMSVEAVDAYNGTGPFENIPEQTEIDALSAAPALRDYLLDNIRVSQDGSPCPGEVQPIDNFLNNGALLLFTCRDLVQDVDLEVTMLHDRDPAYETFSVDGTEWYALHTDSASQHRWTPKPFRVGRDADAGVTVVAALTGIGGLVALACALPWARRRAASGSRR